MTNEFIKVLILFSLYAALEIALFSSSIGRLVSRVVRPPGHRKANRNLVGQALSDQDARAAE
jgi:hypothetical protein